MATRDEGPVPHSQITELLVRWREGDHAALNQLVPLVYDELRRLARSHLRRKRPVKAFKAQLWFMKRTCAWSERSPPDWQNRAHFFGVAARLMREILVDRTRKFRAAKRGRGGRRTSIG